MCRFKQNGGRIVVKKLSSLEEVIFFIPDVIFVVTVCCWDVPDIQFWLLTVKKQDNETG